MILLSNNVAQTVEPGQAVQLPLRLVKNNTCCCNGPSTTSVKLCQKGTYVVGFHGNVSGASGTQPNLAIAVGGEVRPETTMVATIAAAGNVFNVSAETLVGNCCCDMDRVTVVNTGTTPVILSANPALIAYKLHQ